MAVKCALIPEWRKAWRFSSVRLMALGGTCQLTLLALPEKVSQHLPEYVMQGLAFISAASIFLGIAGRVTKSGRHVEPPTPANRP